MRWVDVGRLQGVAVAGGTQGGGCRTPTSRKPASLTLMGMGQLVNAA